MRRALGTYCLILLGILFSACEDSTDPAPIVESGSIVPLRVGNQWAYKMFVYDAGGAVIDTLTDTTTIVSSTTIGSETWYMDDEGILQTNRADGRWINSGTAYLVEKYPAELNDNYLLNDPTIRVRIRGKAENVSVAAGSFSCYVYRWTRNDTLVGDFFFAPNVGLVQSEKYSGGTYINEKKVLVGSSLQ